MDTSDGTEAVASTNRLSMNRLSMNRLSMNGLSSSRLSSADGLRVTDTPLLLDQAGRELLRYIVRCALKEGQVLTATVDSTDYTFRGSIGLAPSWLTSPLSEKQQRWLSACLLAHVNGYGIEVPISLRGRHEALSTVSTERTTYSHEEVSFYGNVFIPHDAALDEFGELGPRMYSCGGQNLQARCGGSTSTFRPTRSCGTNMECPLNFAGPCYDLTDAEADACVTKDKTGYVRCHTETRNDAGTWPKEAAYNEVITVYLTEQDFDSLYLDCMPLP